MKPAKLSCLMQAGSFNKRVDNMDAKMEAAERAAEITLILRKDSAVEQTECRQVLATEIPIDSSYRTFGVMVNLGVNQASISLPVLWTLTVPVIHKLFSSGKLNEFEWVGTQVVALEGQVSLGRVLRVESLVKEIENIVARKADDLLNDFAWDARKFSCHWYWDKESVSR